MDELCDALLGRTGDQIEDDGALLALQVHPEDGPLPEEAGSPNVSYRLQHGLTWSGRTARAGVNTART
ncbi:hypothetical protein OG218_03515 [Kineococcus sp. NBC_00420]|uniref:hypothetical protein n=1 Tax=unclassified Kineococcus TaxID=2621656 RepID=UPI002E21C2D6